MKTFFFLNYYYSVKNFMHIINFFFIASRFPFDILIVAALTIKILINCRKNYI